MPFSALTEYLVMFIVKLQIDEKGGYIGDSL